MGLLEQLQWEHLFFSESDWNSRKNDCQPSERRQGAARPAEQPENQD